MPDMPSACSAREIGVAIDVLCDEIERLRARPIPARDEIIKLWELAMLETTSGLDAMEYFARAILRPNARLSGCGPKEDQDCDGISQQSAARKSVGSGKSVSVRVDLGGRRSLKKKK